MLTMLALAAATVLQPVTVRVHAARDIPRPLVTATLAEASAIWRTAGVTFAWDIVDDAPVHDISVSRDIRVNDAGRAPSLPTLCVTIDSAGGPARGPGMAIGWILFDPAGVPNRDIHLSFANAMELIQSVDGTVLSRMTIMEVRTLLARTLGRALAHELGHYFLASKEHAPSGLMKARRTASEFSGPSRSGFEIEPELRNRVAARLNPAGSLARR